MLLAGGGGGGGLSEAKWGTRIPKKQGPRAVAEGILHYGKAQ